MKELCKLRWRSVSALSSVHQSPKHLQPDPQDFHSTPDGRERQPLLIRREFPTNPMEMGSELDLKFRKATFLAQLSWWKKHSYSLEVFSLWQHLNTLQRWTLGADISHSPTTTELTAEWGGRDHTLPIRPAARSPVWSCGRTVWSLYPTVCSSPGVGERMPNHHSIHSLCIFTGWKYLSSLIWKESVKSCLENHQNSLGRKIRQEYKENKVCGLYGFIERPWYLFLFYSFLLLIIDKRVI